METLLEKINTPISDSLYLKNPESSKLGNKIITQGVLLMDELGFEQFNFKRLAARIHSTESSIYRYFENKHNFLVYISALYWGILDYRLEAAIQPIKNATHRLLKAVEIVTGTPKNIDFESKLDLISLRNIIIEEFTKAYHIKSVNDEISKGYFQPYKQLVLKLVKLINTANNQYPYARSLASSIVNGSLHQHYLAAHFSSITDCKDEKKPCDFYTDAVIAQLKLN
ncbi:MAG: TetR/AcrR family transcriptional regulator [Bacteroidota bacterium]